MPPESRWVWALLLLGTLAGPARADDTRAWLSGLSPEAFAELRRDRGELLARRRAGDVAADLLAIVREEGPADLRARALHLLGRVVDERAREQALAQTPAGEALASTRRGALSAVARRLALLEQLTRLEALRDAPYASPAEERLSREALGLPPEARDELLLLAGDPLLSDARRVTALRLLAWGGDPGARRLAALSQTAPPAELAAILRAQAHRGAPGLGSRLVDLLAAAGDRCGLAAELIPALQESDQLSAFCQRALLTSRLPPWTKAQLASLLGAAQAPQAISSLRRLARDPRGAGLNGREHCAVVVALLRLDREDPGDHLRQLVRYAVSSDVELAEAALAGLDDPRHPSVIEQVEEEMGAVDSDQRVRAMQLGELLGLGVLVVPLADLLKNPAEQSELRQVAAHALGTLGGALSVRALASLLQGEPLSGEKAALRREALDALARCDARSRYGREAIEQALPDEEPSVRRAALRALIAYGDPASRPALAQVLAIPAGSAAEGRLRLEACLTLELYEPESARRVLALWRGHRRDAELGLSTVAYARRLPAELAVPALLALLEQRELEVSPVAERELTRRYPPGKGFLERGGEYPARLLRVSRKLIERWRTAWARDPGSFR